MARRRVSDTLLPEALIAGVTGLHMRHSASVFYTITIAINWTET